MTEEFDLSEKRIELIGFEEDEGRDKYQYDEVDVKEFIKKLKESWASTKDMPEKLFMQLQVQIDTLAGSKLTGENKK